MTATTIRRKKASQFGVGEVLYLYGCDTGKLYGLVQGALLIEEVKHQSDTGVSFFLRPYATGINGIKDIRLSRTYLLEFARTDRLTRMAGPVVTYIIEEVP